MLWPYLLERDTTHEHPQSSKEALQKEGGEEVPTRESSRFIRALNHPRYFHTIYLLSSHYI